jgi:hypothetical protein
VGRVSDLSIPQLIFENHEREKERRRKRVIFFGDVMIIGPCSMSTLTTLWGGVGKTAETRD